MNPISATASAAVRPQPRDTAQGRVKDAVSDFEALLIAQMLRSARSASSLTSIDSEESGSSDAVMEFAEQQLSGTLASAGGLGLATLITEGLAPAAVQASADAGSPQ